MNPFSNVWVPGDLRVLSTREVLLELLPQADRNDANVVKRKSGPGFVAFLLERRGRPLDAMGVLRELLGRDYASAEAELKELYAELHGELPNFDEAAHSNRSEGPENSSAAATPRPSDQPPIPPNVLSAAARMHERGIEIDIPRALGFANCSPAVRRFLDCVGRDGRLHLHHHPRATAGLRWSTTPCFELTKEEKAMVIAPPGFRHIAVDINAAQVPTLALWSNDEMLVFAASQYHPYGGIRRTLFARSRTDTKLRLSYLSCSDTDHALLPQLPGVAALRKRLATLPSFTLQEGVTLAFAPDVHVGRRVARIVQATIALHLEPVIGSLAGMPQEWGGLLLHLGDGLLLEVADERVEAMSTWLQNQVGRTLVAGDRSVPVQVRVAVGRSWADVSKGLKGGR